MKTISLIFAAVLALVSQVGLAAAHADTSTGGHCTGMTVTDFVSSEAQSTTTSAAWQNVTDAHLNFTTSATGCVIITFAGPATASGVANEYAQLHVRTLLDGSNLCVPAQYDDTFLDVMPPSPSIAASIVRTCKNVSAGTHTVQVQFRFSGGGNKVFITSSVLTVAHN